MAYSKSKIEKHHKKHNLKRSKRMSDKLEKKQSNKKLRLEAKYSLNQRPLWTAQMTVAVIAKIN